MKLVGMITWGVTALAAIAVGLIPVGYNVWESTGFVAMHPMVVPIMQYTIGAFGVVSLLMLFGVFGKGNCRCSCNGK